MVLAGKVQVETLIRAPVDKFHEMFWKRPHHISNVSPQNIQNVICMRVIRAVLALSSCGSMLSVIHVFNYLHK